MYIMGLDAADLSHILNLFKKGLKIKNCILYRIKGRTMSR